MTEAVVAGRVDVVLVHNLARIGREWRMTQRYIDLFTRHKVKLLCIRDRLLFDENGATPILTIKNAECNYRTWKNPVISMVCKPSARGFILQISRMFNIEI